MIDAMAKIAEEATKAGEMIESGDSPQLRRARASGCLEENLP